MFKYCAFLRITLVFVYLRFCKCQIKCLQSLIYSEVYFNISKEYSFSLQSVYLFHKDLTNNKARTKLVDVNNVSGSIDEVQICELETNNSMYVV